jgi:hypothetical protein
MELDWKPAPRPKPLENSPTVLGLLQSRGDAAVSALETTHAQLRQLTQTVGQLIMDIRKFDNKIGIPTDPGARKNAMLDNVRRARPDLANLNDEQLLAEIRKTSPR